MKHNEYWIAKFISVELVFLRVFCGLRDRRLGFRVTNLGTHQERIKNDMIQCD